MRYLYIDSKRGHSRGRAKSFIGGPTNERRKNKKATKRQLESRAGHQQWKKSAKTDIANQQLTPDN